MSVSPTILAKLRSLPPLPQVAQQVLAIVRDPEYSIDTLVAVVRTDPALTARLLRLCNAASYGRVGDVRTVGDAVAYLGTRNLVKLVLVSCASTLFQAAGNSQYADAACLWRHSLAVATGAQWLARRGGCEQPDAAFTAGILHNVGKIVLSQLEPARSVEVAPGADLCELEQRWFGIDHATAAGVVAETWQLPGELRFALGHHHDPAAWSDDSPLPALLATADVLAMQQGDSHPLLTPPEMPIAAVSRLQLDRADLEAAAAAVQNELRQHAELLNLARLTSR